MVCDMFEYIFFDAALCDKFVRYAEKRGAACQAADDPLGFVVSVSEDLPDEVLDDLEQYHDLLEMEQIGLCREQGDLKGLASISFRLPDGQERMLPMQIEMANRLLADFSLEEIQRLFGDVARCALNPQQEHLCKLLKDQEG